MVEFGGISGQQLRQLIERVEKLEIEKQDIADNIRDVYAEAKAAGFDVKILRQVVKIRKLDAEKRQEQEAVLDIYMHALGMIPSDETSQAA